MQAQRLGVAIVGCGWAGRQHARSCGPAGADVLWAVDSDASRAEQLRSSHPQGRVATDYREALADPQVEAVIIGLPHHLHAPVAVAAASAGKHILVEKPLAATLDEADAMVGAAAARGVTLMVAENVRYSRRYEVIRELLDRGAIGKVALAQVSREAYLRESFLVERPWYLDARAAAGGIMMSGGIHDVELLRMLVGEIVTVHAVRARQRLAEMEGDDTSVALVSFAGGAAGVLVESFMARSGVTASGSERHALRLDGDLGSVVTDDERAIRVFSEHPAYRVHGGQAEQTIQLPEDDSFARELAHFVHAIRSGEEPLTSGRSQRRPLEIVLAAYRSMELRLPVACPPWQRVTP